MRRMSYALAVLLSLEVAAGAAPVDVSIVPADAGAVIHIDIGAVKRSRVWAAVVKQHGGDPIKMFIDEEGKEEPKARLLMETLANADGVTLWLDDKGEHGVGAFYGVDAARLTRGLAALPGHSTEKLGNRTLHRLGTGDDDDCLVIEGRWVFLSEKPAPIARSLAALDGTGKRLDRTKLEPGANGAILVIAVLGDALLDQVSRQAQSAFLGQGGLEHAKLVVGERTDRLFAKAVVTMRGVDQAMQVEKLASGLMALGQLAAENEDQKRLLRGLHISRTDRVITVDVELTHADLAKMMSEAK